jgi:hypothetical protein
MDFKLLLPIDKLSTAVFIVNINPLQSLLEKLAGVVSNQTMVC